MVRYKARYILFNILYPETLASTKDAPIPTHLDFSAASDPTITPGFLANLIRDSVAVQFGDWGAGAVGSLSVKYFSPITSTGIVRVSREHYRLAWVALTLLNEIKGKPVVVRVVRVSGTIKKAEIAAVRRAKGEIGKVKGMVTVEDLGIVDDDGEGDLEE